MPDRRMPMSVGELEQLIDFLEESLRRERFTDASRFRRVVVPVVERVRPVQAYLARGAGCDGTHRFTREWASATGHDPDDVFDFVERHGGYCDCEVIFNVEPLTW